MRACSIGPYRSGASTGSTAPALTSRTRSPLRKAPEPKHPRPPSRTFSAEGVPQLAECGVGIDGHRHLDITVADDVADDVWRDAEVERGRDAGVADVVEPDAVDLGGLADAAPASTKVVRLQRREAEQLAAAEAEAEGQDVERAQRLVVGGGEDGACLRHGQPA